MIEKFSGIFLLIVFILHFIGHGVYGFRCVFGTKSFLDQYAMHDSGAIMTRFFGSIFIASFIMAAYIMFVRSGGVNGTWGFFNLIFLARPIGKPLIFTAFFAGNNFPQTVCPPSPSSDCPVVRSFLAIATTSEQKFKGVPVALRSMAAENIEILSSSPIR